MSNIIITFDLSFNQNKIIMERFMEDPLKVFLSVIGLVSIILFTCIALPSCESKSKTHFEQAEASLTATQIVNHSSKPITIETLSQTSLQTGIYKVSVDGADFLVVRTSSSVSIHKIN